MKNKIKIDFAFNFQIDSDEIRNFYKKNWSNVSAVIVPVPKSPHGAR